MIRDNNGGVTYNDATQWHMNVACNVSYDNGNDTNVRQYDNKTIRLTSKWQRNDTIIASMGA